MNVLQGLEETRAGTEKEASDGLSARIAKVRMQMVETHFVGIGNKRRDKLNVKSLTAEEAQTIADVLAGADAPEGANDTILVCIEECSDLGIETVDGYPSTPTKKATKKAEK